MATEIQKAEALFMFDEYLDGEFDYEFGCMMFRPNYVLKKCNPEAYLELFQTWARNNEYCIVE